MLALAAALSLGAMTPQRWGADAGPSAVAALLYLGAAGFVAITPVPSTDAGLDRSSATGVVLVGLSGAFVAPVALAVAAGQPEGRHAQAPTPLTPSRPHGEDLHHCHSHG